MRNANRIAVLLFLMSAMASTSAFAQFDLTGSWNARFHEDQPERVPGPSLGDYVGLPINDNARDFLTLVTITDDPVYLTEPLVKTTNFALSPRPLTPQQLLYPCQSVVEIAAQERGAVPHYLPGENPFLADFGKRANLPEAATRGGAATMYPEFSREALRR